MSREDEYIYIHKKNLRKLKKTLTPMIEDYISWCKCGNREEMKAEENKHYAVYDGFIRKDITYMVEDIVREIHKKDMKRKTNEDKL